MSAKASQFCDTLPKLKVAIFILFSASVYGQFQWYNHPELIWETIETAHFKIHYHQGTERDRKSVV